MKFKCNTKELSKACQTVSGAVAKKTEVAALEGIKIKASGGLTLCGYDLEIGITTSIDAKILEPGEAVLDAKTFSSIVKKLPNFETEIRVDEKGIVEIRSGDAEFSIVSIPAKEFPKLPEVKEKMAVELSQPLFKNMIHQTLFAVSQGDAKPIMTGEHLEISKGEITLIAMDGYRIAKAHEKISYDGAAFDCTIPQKAMSEIQKLLSDKEETMIQISVGERHVTFKVGEYFIISRLLDGEYFDYRQAIPKAYTTAATISAADLKSSAERVSLMVSDNLRSPLKCTFSSNSDEVKLCTNTALGSASDSVSADITGGTLEIGFNGRYLLDALSHADCDEVRLQLNGPLNPMVVMPDDGDSFLFLVLPVRLKN